MTPLRMAVLGPGSIADRFLAPAMAKSSSVQLWSVLSRDLARAQDFATRHNAQAPHAAHSDLDTLLADPQLDAVLIATPDALHAPQAIAAARAGKHVFVEKPMATSVDDARAMVDACKEAGKTLGVAYHMRHHAGLQRLESELRAGAIGAVRHVHVQFISRAPDASNWRASDTVGKWWALAAMGTHGIDLCRWMLGIRGEDAELLRCVTSNHVYGSARDESAVVSMRFANGSTAEVFTSTVLNGPRTLTVLGDTGFARAEGVLGPWGKGTVTLGDTPLDFVAVDPYLGELEDFAAAVRDGRSPAVDGEEGARNVAALCEAVP